MVAGKKLYEDEYFVLVNDPLNNGPHNRKEQNTTSISMTEQKTVILVSVWNPYAKKNVNIRAKKQENEDASFDYETSNLSNKRRSS